MAAADRLRAIERNKRINTILNVHVGIQTANAYISTLGGGHFLCRHIDAAFAMARAQLALAVRAGDAGLYGRAGLHMVYGHVKVRLLCRVGAAQAVHDAPSRPRVHSWGTSALPRTCCAGCAPLQLRTGYVRNCRLLAPAARSPCTRARGRAAGRRPAGHGTRRAQLRAQHLAGAVGGARA